MADGDFLAVLTTVDTEERAQALAEGAVARRLAACAQIDAPIRSVYRWQGAVLTDTEWRIVYKTTAARYGQLEAYLLEEHSYDTPEVIATPITEGSDAYLSWLRTETEPNPPAGQ
ncbi:cation tolerance protein CutA [Wenjunlia vitaminophila]|uniref:Cation tolerance protein CutA n=1 Tax=Wenjunlia vitaminophila TaxID=76728 RepID=A0A0T6LSX4_WENVI|nr:divalent-cation tolerance protein CutA [Wenjunlia vitaminophila]KRV49112.1 cation tolerance protein CutA [Wenjunlia vitaminophila]